MFFIKSFKVTDAKIDIILKACNLMTARTTKFWLSKYINEEYDGLYTDGRSCHRTDFFYDMYPDIKTEAKIYSMSQSEDKSSFTTLKLVEHIKNLYIEETEEHFEENEIVRSESSCRRDLLDWGFYLGSNFNRSYFEGHERDDVVAVRNKLVDYFTDRKHLYYTLTEKEGD